MPAAAVIEICKLLVLFNTIHIGKHLLGPEQGTCKYPVVFQMIIIRARAGNLQGPYCFSNDSLLGPEQGTCKDPIVFQMIFFSFSQIFHCLNIPQNSHLAKNFISIVVLNFLPPWRCY